MRTRHKTCLPFCRSQGDRLTLHSFQLSGQVPFRALRYSLVARTAGRQPDPHLLIGVMYCDGVGVARDAGEGVRWTRAAAEGGWASVQYTLGLAYLEGVGVERDQAEAVRWFRAAGPDHAGAQNEAKALEHLRQAAEDGWPAAQNDYGLIHAKGFGWRRTGPRR